MSIEPPIVPSFVTEALSTFARGVRDRFGARVSEIVLFGSYARGEATEDEREGGH